MNKPSPECMARVCTLGNKLNTILEARGKLWTMNELMKGDCPAAKSGGISVRDPITGSSYSYQMSADCLRPAVAAAIANLEEKASETLKEMTKALMADV